MIAAVVHKNCDSSRTPTRKLQTAETISVRKLYLSLLLLASDLLTISSQILSIENYKSGTGGLEVLHKYYNTDVLGVLLIYPHSPSGAVRPRESCVYISQTPRGRVITY